MSIQNDQVSPTCHVGYINEVTLVGRLAEDPFRRPLPQGGTVVGWRMIVDRPPRPDGRRVVDTIPCATFDEPTGHTTTDWRAGDLVEAHGSLRRRFRRSDMPGTSRFEVEVTQATLLAPAHTPSTTPATHPQDQPAAPGPQAQDQPAAPEPQAQDQPAAPEPQAQSRPAAPEPQAQGHAITSAPQTQSRPTSPGPQPQGNPTQQPSISELHAQRRPNPINPGAPGRTGPGVDLTAPTTKASDRTGFTPAAQFPITTDSSAFQHTAPTSPNSDPTMPRFLAPTTPDHNPPTHEDTAPPGTEPRPSVPPPRTPTPSKEPPF